MTHSPMPMMYVALKEWYEERMETPGGSGNEAQRGEIGVRDIIVEHVNKEL